MELVDKIAELSPDLISIAILAKTMSQNSGAQPIEALRSIVDFILEQPQNTLQQVVKRSKEKGNQEEEKERREKGTQTVETGSGNEIETETETEETEETRRKEEELRRLIRIRERTDEEIREIQASTLRLRRAKDSFEELIENLRKQRTRVAEEFKDVIEQFRCISEEATQEVYGSQDDRDGQTSGFRETLLGVIKEILLDEEAIPIENKAESTIEDLFCNQNLFDEAAEANVMPPLLEAQMPEL